MTTRACVVRSGGGCARRDAAGGVSIGGGVSRVCPTATFDSLVLDVQFGGIAEIELQRLLTASGERTPVIFITAHDAPEARDRALAAGCTGYFRKNDSGAELVDAIGRAAARLSLDAN